jgi:6,7-dimethyl-8-ribityllumazine synthase
MSGQRREIQGKPFAAPPRVAVVVSRYNQWITDALQTGAVQEYVRRFGSETGLTIVHAPGSFEVPTLAHEAAASGKFQAVVALGCVIRGETTHDQHINHAVSNQIVRSACETGVPIGFGILTVENALQAEARAGGDKGNKGAEAMAAALDTAMALAGLREEVH